MPYFTYPTNVLTPDIEFLADENGLITVSHTILPDGIEPDEQGKKYAIKGSFVDKDGKILKPTFSAESVTFDTDPVGILFASVNVTYGPAMGAIMYRGRIRGEWFNWGDNDYVPALAKSVQEKLPGIDFVDGKGNVIYGPTSTEIPGVDEQSGE